MLLPDIEVMIARDRIEERLRDAEWRKCVEESLQEAKRNTKKRPERGWLRQLFLGKAGA